MHSQAEEEHLVTIAKLIFTVLQDMHLALHVHLDQVQWVYTCKNTAGVTKTTIVITITNISAHVTIMEITALFRVLPAMNAPQVNQQADTMVREVATIR